MRGPGRACGAGSPCPRPNKTRAFGPGVTTTSGPTARRDALVANLRSPASAAVAPCLCGTAGTPRRRRSRGCLCPEAIARGARCGPRSLPVCGKQRPRGSVRRPGCDREQPRRTLQLAVASMTHRHGRPLARGAGERACGSISRAAAAARAPAGAVAPSTWCPRRGTSTPGPLGRCSNWSRSVRPLVVVRTSSEISVGWLL